MNQCFLLASVITPVIDIVEVQRFRTTIATAIAFTQLQRSYDFERELRVNGELSFYEGERMCQYFGLRASQVILVVVETFLDLTIESRELILSLRFLGLVKNSTFSLI